MELPISNEKILKLLKYSFTDTEDYDECTETEKAILDAEDFNAIKQAIKEVE